MPLAALTVGLVFSPTAAKALSFCRAVTNNTSLTLWLLELRNPKKQRVGQTYSDQFFFVPKKTDVANKSGFWRH